MLGKFGNGVEVHQRSEKFPVIKQKLTPYIPIALASILEGSEPTCVRHQKERRVLLHDPRTDLQLRLGVPASVVQRSTAVVVPYSNLQVNFTGQKKLGHLGEASPAGDVEETFTEAVETVKCFPAVFSAKGL